MNSTEFIKKRIDELVSKFSYVRCTYELDKFDDTHTLKISPQSEFMNNKELDSFMNDTYSIFFENYPFEGIFIIAEDDDNYLYGTIICSKVGSSYKN